MQSIIKADYIAGLWNVHLTSQLTWRVKGDRPQQCDESPAKRPDKWRSPSFSWMAVDGMISPANSRSKGLLADVVGVHVEPLTSDPTGLLKSGYLRLRGRLEKLELKTWHLARHDLRERQWVMVLNGRDMLISGVPEEARLAGLVHLDVSQTEFRHPLYYMNVFAEDDYLAGLILELIDRSAGTFRRIGCFASAKEEGIKLMLEEHPTTEATPCESYDPETQKPIIRII